MKLIEEQIARGDYYMLFQMTTGDYVLMRQPVGHTLVPPVVSKPRAISESEALAWLAMEVGQAKTV